MNSSSIQPSDSKIRMDDKKPHYYLLSNKNDGEKFDIQFKNVESNFGGQLKAQNFKKNQAT